MNLLFADAGRTRNVRSLTSPSGITSQTRQRFAYIRANIFDVLITWHAVSTRMTEAYTCVVAHTLSRARVCRRANVYTFGAFPNSNFAFHRIAHTVRHPLCAITLLLTVCWFFFSSFRVHTMLATTETCTTSVILERGCASAFFSAFVRDPPRSVNVANANQGISVATTQSSATVRVLLSSWKSATHFSFHFRFEFWWNFFHK